MSRSSSAFLIAAIAAVCHEVNRALCVAFGDLSQKPWAEAEQWQRDSAIRGVEFALANPDAPPSAQHDAWMADKLADGWVYGPVKDPDAKTHPCIVPYDDLPPEQRAKDHTFRAVVATMLRQSATVLMGPQNPTGWKLEDLLPQIAGEVEAKTLKIASDPRPVARLVAENNDLIVKHLEEAEKLQRASYAALDAMAPNQGPLGKPRIGVGSGAN